MRYFKFLLIVLTGFTVACSTEDIQPALCSDGVCDGALFVPFPKDANGFYHVDLDFSSDILPRFSIFVEGDDVDPFYYYNDMGVVQAAFASESSWMMSNNIEIGIVQSTTIYLNNSSQNKEYQPSIPTRKWGKRVVGPIPIEFVGDTITIRAEIYWDGGSKSKSQLFEEKFIIQ